MQHVERPKDRAGFLIIIFVSLLPISSSGQIAPDNTCDSFVLNSVEYSKCTIDSVWTHDLAPKINYTVALKTIVLPKFRPVRRSLQLPPLLITQVRQLKNLYDSVLEKKVFMIEKEMDKNQLFVQPRAYISAVLSLQLFNFYPDIYAILLNNIHLKTHLPASADDIIRYKTLVNRVIDGMPAELFDQITRVTDQMQTERRALPNPMNIQLLQGLVQEQDRIKYEVVNFLLWTVE